MKKVLIIGANSYIGQKFYSFVDNNCKEKINITLVSASDGSWRKIDFSSYDCILHLSAIVHQKEKKQMKELYYNVNYKLAVEIAQLAKVNGVRQFIFMSTAAVYNPNINCINKNTKPDPKSYYGIYKLAAEDEIDNLKNNSYKVAIIRSPMVYGKGCKGNYKKLETLAKYLPIFPDYHNKRSMIHIDTLCKFIIDLIDNEKSGLYFPQESKYIDTCEMFVELRKQMGKRTKLIRCFNFLIRFLLPYNKIINKMFGDFYYID